MTRSETETREKCRRAASELKSWGMNAGDRCCGGGRCTKDGLFLVSNTSKLRIRSLGDDYESLGQSDELVEVAHVGCVGLELVKGREVHIRGWKIHHA